MCTVPLPPGVYPIAVDKYIIKIRNRDCCSKSFFGPVSSGRCGDCSWQRSLYEEPRRYTYGIGNSWSRYNIVTQPASQGTPIFAKEVMHADLIALDVKGKAIPLQAWTGPEGSSRLRLPDFKTNGTWKW